MKEENRELPWTSLSSGGLITNYNCSSACRHCVYYSSPRREQDYLSAEQARPILEKIRQLGCDSLHIGGGEPLLRPAELMKVLDEFRAAEISVEYVETNSSWFRELDDAVSLLVDLRSHGLDTLLISIDPFHNEFIPFNKVRGVLQACRRTGMGIFAWIEGFIPDIAAFPEDRTHSLEEYSRRFGPDYLRSLSGRYGINFRGRALDTYRPFMHKRPLAEILAEPACGEPLDTHHFHVDLYGNFLPTSCAGFAVALTDLDAPGYARLRPPESTDGRQGGPLATGRYPFLTAVIESGVAGLYKLAAANFGFQARPDYVSKCDLCQAIRTFLVNERGVVSPDLAPAGFYRESAQAMDGQGRPSPRMDDRAAQAIDRDPQLVIQDRKALV